MKRTLEATSNSTKARCACLPSKTGVVYPFDPLTQWDSPPFVETPPKRAWVSFLEPFSGSWTVLTIGSAVDINELCLRDNVKTE